MGIVVFSDVLLPRRPGYCNMSQGFGECLSGRCYRLDLKCNGRFDCEDGTDESGCKLSSFDKISLLTLIKIYFTWIISSVCVPYYFQQMFKYISCVLYF